MFLLGVDTSISYNLNGIFQISVKFGLLKDQAIPNKQQVRKCSVTVECDRTKENPWGLRNFPYICIYILLSWNEKADLSLLV